MPAPHHGRRDRVVNEKHSDQQRNQRERGEVELKRAKHPFDLPVAAVRRLDEDVRGQFATQPRDDRVKIRARPHQRGDARELPGVEKILLHIGDVHHAQVLVRAGRIVTEVEDVADMEHPRAGLRLEPQRIADLELEALAQGARDGDDVRIAQEIFHIRRQPLRILQLKRAQRRIGENIDAEQLQIFAGIISEARHILHRRRGGDNIGIVVDNGPRLLIKAQAVANHLEVRLARHDIDRGAKRLQRAVVDDLHRQKNGHAQRDADNVQRRECRMPREVAQTVSKKKAEHPNSTVAAFYNAAILSKLGCSAFRCFSY